VGKFDDWCRRSDRKNDSFKTMERMNYYAKREREENGINTMHKLNAAISNLMYGL